MKFQKKKKWKDIQVGDQLLLTVNCKVYRVIEKTPVGITLQALGNKNDTFVATIHNYMDNGQFYKFIKYE